MSRPYPPSIAIRLRWPLLAMMSSLLGCGGGGTGRIGDAGPACVGICQDAGSDGATGTVGRPNATDDPLSDAGVADAIDGGAASIDGTTAEAGGLLPDAAPGTPDALPLPPDAT